MKLARELVIEYIAMITITLKSLNASKQDWGQTFVVNTVSNALHTTALQVQIMSCATQVPYTAKSMTVLSTGSAPGP